MLHIAEYFPITDPTLIFFVVLLIILFAPIIMGKLRIPHIIGMVLAGVLVGKYGLNILERDSSFELFGKVGLYYISRLGNGHGRHEEEQDETTHLWSSYLFRAFFPYVRHEYLAASLFLQGFHASKLYHGIQHLDSLSYRGTLWIATEAKRYVECGFQYAFTFDSPHHAGGSRSFIFQARRYPFLAIFRSQVCCILRIHDISDS